ncbi:MAG: sulfatase-like hydrolase/transferase [Gammaproteobacteria bacterium]
MKFVPSLVFPCLFTLGFFCAHLSERAAPASNVILILTDDQGYGDLGCHGNPVVKTPHLDRLHTESIRFTDFHSAPMCTPTRGQLMTGMDAESMNVSIRV